MTLMVSQYPILRSLTEGRGFMIVSLMILSLVLILANMIRPTIRGTQVVSVIATIYIMPTLMALIVVAMVIIPVKRISKLFKKNGGGEAV